MRGTAPLIVALVSASYMGEQLSPLAWSGVTAISLGILSIALGNALRDRKGASPPWRFLAHS